MTEEEGPEFPWETAEEFCNNPVNEPKWLIRPWIIEGGLTELSGKVKESGKTTLIFTMCKALVTGTPFMDEPVMKSPVIYLSEQPAASLVVQLREAKLDKEENFYLLRWPNVAHHKWEYIVNKAIEKALEVGAKLLVIDTFSRWAGLDEDAENSSGSALRALKPIRIANKYDLAVFINRHAVKRSDVGVADAGRGSSAITGEMDIVLYLKRVANLNTPNTRMLESLSRFPDTPEAAVIEWNPETGEYLFKGHSVKELQTDEQADWLVNYLDEEENAYTIKEILESWPWSQSQLYDKLKALVTKGILGEKGKGARGDAKKYWVV